MACSATLFILKQPPQPPWHWEKGRLFKPKSKKKEGESSKTSSKIDRDFLLSEIKQKYQKLYYLLLKSG